MRPAELVRLLQSVPEFARPDAAREQVVTPAEAAAELLTTAHRRGDIADRDVADLGAGTGRLAIGAKALGARTVRAVEVDPLAVEVARSSAIAHDLPIEFVVERVEQFDVPVDIVVMNPPFGAQTRHADRPFWETALTVAGRSVYAFALADSRTFIEKRAVARGASIEEIRPVPWTLPPTFPHHRRRRVELAVDLWVISTGATP